MRQKRRRQAAWKSSPTAKSKTRSGNILPRGGHQGHIPVASLPDRSASARDRAFHVLAAMRRDPSLSLTRAAKLKGVKPQTVKKHVSSALRKTGGKFTAAKSDRFVEIVYLPAAHGNPVPVSTHSSRQRSEASNYLRDLGRYLRGDRNALSKWHGKKIAGLELLTAGRTIVAIEPALSEFSLYRAFNGGGV